MQIPGMNSLLKLVASVKGPAPKTAAAPTAPAPQMGRDQLQLSSNPEAQGIKRQLAALDQEKAQTTSQKRKMQIELQQTALQARLSTVGQKLTPDQQGKLDEMLSLAQEAPMADQKRLAQIGFSMDVARRQLETSRGFVPPTAKQQLLLDDMTNLAQEASNTTDARRLTQIQLAYDADALQMDVKSNDPKVRQNLDQIFALTQEAQNTTDSKRLTQIQLQVDDLRRGLPH